MKKHDLIILAIVLIFSSNLSGQIKQDCNGKVGINCEPTVYTLKVNGSAYSSKP